MKAKIALAGLALLLYCTNIHARMSIAARLKLQGNNTDEEAAKNFLAEFNKEYGRLFNLQVIAEWEHSTNLTDENAEAFTEAELKLSAYSDLAFEKAIVFDPSNFNDDTRRQLFYVGSKSLSGEEMKNLSELISSMGSIYGKGQVCRESSNGKEECLQLEPGLTDLLANSRNASEHLWAWEGWRTNVARQIRPLYIQYVELKNKMAVLNGYTDYGDEWRQKYEDPEFESDVLALYNEMKPLYLQLHAYMRRKLFQTYGPEVVDITGPLPQHILGDMWGRFWLDLNSIGVPYPDKPSLDVTSALIAQNYTITRLFETGDDFYKSMGLLPLPSNFYNLSMLEKPTDREVECHPSAYDFYDAKDFRISMCTKINFNDFLTIHHEIGHIQYFMQCSNQPIIFRDGANDGFHEAVGELMSMCVSTPKHLHTIGLLDELPSGDETTINYLFLTSLSTISTLPFHLLQDTWRWKTFRGDFPDVSTWNDEFWRLSEEIVGVKSPIPRSPEDLDGPSINHVATDTDMIRYFTRTILQFQFAEALCEAAGHKGPLNECDFYGSVDAGNKLAAMLQLGSSKPWPDALEALTGVRKMNATAIRKYFEPLEKWLINTNAQNGDTPGWTTSAGVKVSV